MIDDLALGYVKHNLALLAAPVLLGAIALVWRPFRLTPFPALARGANSGVNVSQARNVWIVQAVVAIEVRQVADLPEAVDAQRADPLAQHPAQPGEGGG